MEVSRLKYGILNESWSLAGGLISFELISEVCLDAISNEGRDFISEWLDKKGKRSWEEECLVEMIISFSEVTIWSFEISLEEAITKLKTSRVEWNLEYVRW